MKGKFDKTVPVGMRRCSRCKEPKSLDEFSKATNSRDGRFSYCHLCLKEKNSERTPALRQQWHLSAKYNISREEYLRKSEEQGGRCAICKQGESGRDIDGRWLAVDHDHKTKKVRGLLCTRCNTLLALLEERPDIIILMREYLALHTSSQIATSKAVYGLSSS